MYLLIFIMIVFMVLHWKQTHLDIITQSDIIVTTYFLSGISFLRYN